MQPKDSFDEIFGKLSKILVVLGHPDDNEIICGGTVARLLDSGKQVRLVVMTTGGKGFQDQAAMTEKKFAGIRRAEQKKAGLALGLPEEENFNLGIPDGELELTVENIGKVVYHIRQFRPDIVITHNPFDVINKYSEDIRWVNHRDHRHTAQIVLDAMYPYSRDRGFFPEHFEDGLEGHSVSRVLFSDAYSYEDVSYFEVTKYMKKKEKALNTYEIFTDEEIEEEFLEETRFGGKNFERMYFVEV